GGDLLVTSTGGFSSRIANLIAGHDFNSNLGGDVSANHITITATTGSVSLGSMLTSTGASNTVDITGHVNVTSSAGGMIFGNDIAITATTGFISLVGTVTGTGSGNMVALTSHDDLTAASVGVVTAETLFLTSTAGSIGSSGSHVLTATQHLNLSAFGD